jgi:hypothetical protein
MRLPRHRDRSVRDRNLAFGRDSRDRVGLQLSAVHRIRAIRMRQGQEQRAAAVVLVEWRPAATVLAVASLTGSGIKQRTQPV